MDDTPQKDPPRTARPLKAPLAMAGLAFDWATLALLGVATVALAVATRLPRSRRTAPTKDLEID